MCGIVGVLLTPDFSASPDDAHRRAEGALELMVNSVRHRGPDDQGAVILGAGENGIVGLGHTRLAILDTSSAGHQPMGGEEQGARSKEQGAKSEGRRAGSKGQVAESKERRGKSEGLERDWITFNGEIYNFRELRQGLERAYEDFASQSDTEVILRLFARYGRDCLHQLRGMFAFAIWDARRQELFLARDRLGIKPLYYYVGDGFFLFASEVRALLATGLVPRTLDEVALWEYLAYQSVPAPRTLIKGVRALLPGSWLTVSASGEVNECRYWDLLEQSSPEAQSVPRSESRRKVGELLRESVAFHLVSDVPVAAFLSGGIDSSAVAALMREVGQTPQTFSVVFNESAYTEAQFARLVADRVQADHTEIRLTEQSLIDQLPEALGAMDQPTGDGVNTYVVSRAVSAAGIKVALSGLGGDEFFAGYPSFARLGRTARYLRYWGNAPAGVRSLAARAFETVAGASVAAAKTASIIEGDGSIASTFPTLRQVLLPTQRRELLTERFFSAVSSAQDPYTAMLHDAFGRTQAEVLSQVSYAEARTYMHDVLLRDTDQMSMAHALEVRVPLLDHKLVEYVMGLPDEHKRSNGTPKRLLVESLNGLLPPEVVHRPKQGFTLPFDVWMRGAMRQFCEERLSPDRISGRGIMNPHQVQHLWRGFLDQRSDVTWSRLWMLVVLEEWLEHNGVRCE